MVPEASKTTKVVAESLGNERSAAPVAHQRTDAPSLKVSIKRLVELPEWKNAFTESAVRGLIDKSRTRYSSRGLILGNGLIEAGAIIRVRRKILIDCDRFRAWVESHRISHSTSSGEYDHEQG